MAVTEVNKLWSGRTGEDGITRRRTFKEVWEVLTNDVNDDATVAGGDDRLPRLGDKFSSDAAALVIKLVPEQDEEDVYRWLVSVDYDTELPYPEVHDLNDDGESEERPTPNQRAEKPTDRPTVWRYGYVSKRVLLKRASWGAHIKDEDENMIYQSKNRKVGKPPKWFVPDDGYPVSVLNSAGDPFDPPVEDDDELLVITCTKNVPSVSLDELEALKGAVNSKKWKGRDTHTCRVTGAEAQSKYENGVAFYEKTVTVTVDPKTWDIPVLDRGTREWVPGSEGAPEENPGKYVPFLDSTGQPTTELLDGQGRKLGEGKPPVYLYFSNRPYLDFNTAIGN